MTTPPGSRIPVAQAVPAIILALVFALGCTPAPISGWKQFYSTNQFGGKFPPTEDEAQLRRVSVEDFDNLRHDVDDYYRSKGRAPEDATKEDRLASRAFLIKHTRLPFTPDSITVIGTSAFNGPLPAEAETKHLVGFARRDGANVILIGQRALGEKTGSQIINVPSYSMGSATVYNRFGGSTTATGSAWGMRGEVVPYTYTEYENVSVLVRHMEPAEAAAYWSGADMVKWHADQEALASKKKR